MRWIFLIAGIANGIGCIQQIGFAFNLWGDPQLNSAIIIGGLMAASAFQIDAFFEWKRS